VSGQLPHPEDTLEARFAARMGQLLGPDFPTDLGLAVSGGGDSMAMLALGHGWARAMGVRLWVVTIDHGLREDSTKEAAMVAAECAALGHSHAVLRWRWNGQGNLLAAARRGRLALIDSWRGEIAHVLFAHTRDDVAETFLMRLARGAGVEGLSAMPGIRHVQPHHDTPPKLKRGEVTQPAAPPDHGGQKSGFYLVRPLLHECRTDLRHFIETLKVPYVNDPMNEDARFNRVKARQALSTLGIDAETLHATAGRMLRASEALAQRTASVAQHCVTEDTCQGVPTGDLMIDRNLLAEIEEDTQLRLLAAALQWISSAEYRPRVLPLAALLHRALAGGGGTLHGVRIIPAGARLRVTREFAAVQNLRLPLGCGEITWDGRWHVQSNRPHGLTLRALGPDGWQQAAAKPEGLPPHDAATTLPALFASDRLIAWYPADRTAGFRVRFAPLRGHFITFLQSH